MMGVRANKGNAIARYLLGRTGIVGISWDSATGSISMPYPYQIDLTTSRKLQNWHDRLASYPSQPTPIHACVRYDNGMEDITNAWVGMKIDPFIEMLSAHHYALTADTEGQEHGTTDNRRRVHYRRRP